MVQNFNSSVAQYIGCSGEIVTAFQRKVIQGKNAIIPSKLNEHTDFLQTREFPDQVGGPTRNSTVDKEPVHEFN